MNKISFVGSGNVAYHLSKTLKNVGFTISSVSSKNTNNAKALAKNLNTKACLTEEIDPSVDLVIIAVSDDSISEVIQALPQQIQSVIHTSGSIPMEVFQGKFENFGVFYPLQSFNKDQEIDMSSVPFLIEANTAELEKDLKYIAERVSTRAEIMDSEARKHLHLAAVIANNFVNYLATEAYSILEEQNIDGSLIRPLMLETILRLENNHPKHMQTGPAKRNDKEVLKMQEELLKSNPKLQSLYRQISELIMQRYNGPEL